MGWVDGLAQCALDFLIDEQCHACGAGLGDAPWREPSPSLAAPLEVVVAGSFRLRTRLLCVPCAQQIRRWPGRILLPASLATHDAGDPLAFFPVFVTDERLLAIVHLLKFGRHERVAPWLARAMAPALPDFASISSDPRWLVVPVPMDHHARARRGFNQAERIARTLAAHWRLPVSPRALQKLRRTRPQSKLGREERLTNLEGAFRAGAGAVRGMRVILVDDLVTTGATVRACAGALGEAGALEVIVVCAGYRDDAAPDSFRQS